jgi:hypothetical protein
LVELKDERVLIHDLVNTVKELNENRTHLLLVILIKSMMPISEVKLVPKLNEILFYQYYESLDRSEVRINGYLCES